MNPRWAAWLIAAATALPAAASLQLPPDARQRLPRIEQGGESRLTFWGFEVYDASLWVAPGFRASQWRERPFALELRYLRDFDGDDIAARSLVEMQRIAPVPAPLAERWRMQMQAAFPDVKKGDRLLGIYLPGEGARFYRNGTPTAAIDDAEFAQRFFAIWLGERSPEPSLREALLAPLPR